MDDHRGAELNQLSRIVFDKAARYWQTSILIELAAGLIGVIVSLAQPSQGASTLWAIVAALVFLIACILRIAFEYKYDAADTMRRQSVLSEGLNWTIGDSQFREWKARAGKRVLSQFSRSQRGQDYYATQVPTGAKRLAEMTLESAFWTRHLYKRMQDWLLRGLIPVAIILLLTASISSFVTRVQASEIVYAIYLAIPVLLSADAIGMVLRIHRAINNLSDIEQSLDQVLRESQPQLSEVMRLVSEYNCIVSAGIVIPRWFYRLYREQIQRFWDA